jgi:hypothetical protein
MIIHKLKEAGYEEAMLGFALSFYDNQTPLGEFWTEEKRKRASLKAKALAPIGGGHNKFLAAMHTWWVITAPRFWWLEFDTYKIATVSLSSSTMHTLGKRLATQEDFQAGTSQDLINAFNIELQRYWAEGDISRLKANLPEGYLQTRVVNLNYMTLQNIIWQRRSHKLKDWKVFVSVVKASVDHPEFLEKKSGGKE